jgi:hypothetical protein
MMGEMADLALEHEMFPDIMYEQVLFGHMDGPDECYEDPQPCYGSDSAKMIERKSVVIGDEDCTPEIPVHEDGYWIRFGDPMQSSSYTGDFAGKYLFFSNDKVQLITIAQNEIWNHSFECAKVSQEARNEDYVLCLYWDSSDRGAELAMRYKDRVDIKYRWWKSNEDTRRGKYSKQNKRRRK